MASLHNQGLFDEQDMMMMMMSSSQLGSNFPFYTNLPCGITQLKTLAPIVPPSLAPDSDKQKQDFTSHQLLSLQTSASNYW